MVARLRRPVPPPERLSAKDVLHIIFGFLMLPLGAVILYRVLRTAPSLTGIVVGLAFMAFGVHRLYTALTRCRMLRRDRTKS